MRHRWQDPQSVLGQVRDNDGTKGCNQADKEWFDQAKTSCAQHVGANTYLYQKTRGTGNKQGRKT